jgi:uncharacterized protein
MKHLFYTLLLLFMASAPLAAQSDVFEQKIIKLFDVQGSRQQFEMAIDQMIDIQMQSAGSNADMAAFFEQFKAEIKTEGFDDLYAILIPIYRKHFTEADVDALLAFYDSPAGKKMVSVMPLITQESMAAGAAWGQQLAEKIIKRLEEKK